MSNKVPQHFTEIAQRNGCERVLVDTRRNLSEPLADYRNQRSQLARAR